MVVIGRLACHPDAVQPYGAAGVAYHGLEEQGWVDDAQERAAGWVAGHPALQDLAARAPVGERDHEERDHEERDQEVEEGLPLVGERDPQVEGQGRLVEA